MPKTLMLVAAEPSGDILGAEVLTALRQHHPDLRCIGVGGSHLAAAGMEILFPLQDLAVMGLVEVLPALPRLYQRLRQLTNAADRHQIDALLTIDGQDFNRRLAQRVKRRMQVPCIHYGAPTVWAWRAQRAATYAKIFDHLCCLFPFEPAYFTPHGLPATYVGHPVYQRLQTYQPQHLAPPSPLQLAVMPGSRAGEIQRHWPILRAAAQRLQAQLPGLRLLAVLPDAAQPFQSLMPTAGLKNFDVVVGPQRFAALQGCRAALAKSGTGNLELAMLGVPMVVGYRVHPVTAILARYVLRVPYVSPVNWVAGQYSVPELLQGDFTPDGLAAQVLPLLQDATAWHAAASQLAQVRENLNTGYHNGSSSGGSSSSFSNNQPATKVARIIQQYLSAERIN